MDTVEQSILGYLEGRQSDWKWMMGSESYGKTETITKFKHDKKFRSFVVSQVTKLATELFTGK